MSDRERELLAEREVTRTAEDAAEAQREVEAAIARLAAVQAAHRRAWDNYAAIRTANLRAGIAVAASLQVRALLRGVQGPATFPKVDDSTAGEGLDGFNLAMRSLSRISERKVLARNASRAASGRGVGCG